MSKAGVAHSIKHAWIGGDSNKCSPPLQSRIMVQIADCMQAGNMATFCVRSSEWVHA
ncbi:hypothetical protein LLG46_07555 [bacterium]|nr:hypothetical protein [bacterium]